MRSRIVGAISSVALLMTLITSGVYAPSAKEAFADIELPGPLPEGGTLLPNPAGWVLTPAGYQISVGDLPLGMTLSPNGKYLAVTNNGYSSQFVSIIDTISCSEIQRLPLDKSFHGIAFSPDDNSLYVSGGRGNKILVYGLSGDLFTPRNPIILGPRRAKIFPCGLAVSSGNEELYVANLLESTLTVVNLDTGKPKADISVGSAPCEWLHRGGVLLSSFPYDVVVSKDGSKLYVSNWGEEIVSVIDRKAQEVSKAIKVGSHPNAMVLSPEGKALYVANANTDDVSIVDTAIDEVIGAISLQPYPGAPFGSTPNALAISPDGKTLYVANAGNNDVAVIDLLESKIKGLIPVGWYPTALAISPDGKTLYVANGKGLGSQPNPEGPCPYKKRTSKTQYIGGLLWGTVSVINIPDDEELAEYTAQAEKNNGFSEAKKEKIGQSPETFPIPRRIGEGSPLKHVIYIIKENRTYDQVFGDMAQGNGDPNLCLFGYEVTPNHHALAEEFVLLDNFYVDAEVSADGHEWSCAAMATDFVEKTWPTYYSHRGLFYPSEGTCPAAYPVTGYLWDVASRQAITYRSYGEFIDWNKRERSAYTNMENLKGHFAPYYRPWDLNYPDVMRGKEFIREFEVFEENGDLPELMIVRLPNDHNYGTVPGKPTPRAMTADNDLALGMIVDSVSHSKYWKDTVIFVVEDDAQNGPDHVDCHRTVALAISPYIKRGYVDHTMYDTCSMLKTMELILGLPPMSQYDAAAVPMLNCFQGELDLTPYDCQPNLWPLDETNHKDAYGARECMAMDFEHIDATPMVLHNEIVWKSIRGADSEMPLPVSHRVEMELDED
jgi:YVTN family beta-propeller protein